MPLRVTRMRYDNIPYVLRKLPPRACVRRSGRVGGCEWSLRPSYDVFRAIRAVFCSFLASVIPFPFVLFFCYIVSIPWFLLSECLGSDTAFIYL